MTDTIDVIQNIRKILRQLGLSDEKAKQDLYSTLCDGVGKDRVPKVANMTLDEWLTVTLQSLSEHEVLRAVERLRDGTQN
jgi:hypothetical protein